MRLPGLGPKTARRLWQELGITTVAALAAAAEAQQLRGLGRARREVGGEDPGGARQAAGGRGPAARAAREDAAEAARGRRGARGAPGRGQVSIAGSARRVPRDGARPRPDRDRVRRGGAARRVLLAAVGRRGGGEGRHEGDGRRAGRPALRPARRPAGVVRQSAPALHGLEGPQRRAARGGGAARALGLRVRRSPRSRAARCTRFATEEEVYALSRLRRGFRPSCARTAASSRRRATASCRSSSSCGDLRGDLHTHTTWSDGKDTLEAMVAAALSRRATSTTRSATTRSACATSCSQQQTAAIDALQRARAAPDPQGDRGEHPRRRRARRRR